MDQSFLSQLGASLYQLTSLQWGDYNLADMAASLQDSFLNSTFVLILQIISLIITGFLAIATIRLSRRQKEFDQKTAEVLPAEVLGAGLLQEQWHDILHHIESTREGEWKFAVIEADTLVDNVLKNYFTGDTMGERLMNIDKTK